MRLSLLLFSLVISVGTYSCRTAEKTNEQTPTRTSTETFTADSIVRDTVTNSKGVKLAMEYNKARHSATFVLAGKAIILRQDTTASGLRYSNTRYEYTEHQGQLTLKKEGKIIFRKP
ncbi:hypothetical protein GCM10028818_56100 [Spirosoma horti]